MAKFTVKNIELEFDIFELEKAELFEKEAKIVIEKAKNAVSNTVITAAIKEQCYAVFDFIDALFGEGTHKKIFGESVNLRECTKVFQEICQNIEKDKQAFADETLALTNRQQRRAAAKKKKK